ncbi:hypothetical protein [Aerosakkonema funiforme]|uniref:Uncharacterized protein n=1 Tax=Aerosakkonema funiforme FACHB-1375 TaxID=2949571 RepID=A0A926VLM2_9CYAN|nr:hypothetical protein [Aerosakkonema funiforme]MBD2186190.1 hypothetical protein [Aerosakkonema funiforme FACHB-1375]
MGQTRGNVESDSSVGLQNASVPTGADIPPSEAPLISEIQVSSKPSDKEQASNSVLTNNTAVPITVDDRLPSDTRMRSRSHPRRSQAEPSTAQVTPQRSINRLGHIVDESASSSSLPTSSDRTSEFLTVAIGNSPQNLLSGAGRVGEVLTSPRVRSRSSVKSGGFSSDTITVESRDPQLWSAVLDGFFTPLARRLEKRSDKAVEELLNRPNIAMLPKGTKVSLVLNSFLNVNR